MLERAPYKNLSRAQWRRAMLGASIERQIKVDVSGAAGNMEVGRILRDALVRHRNGTPTTPHWTALPLLP
jgi:hypothetical protein